jgi:NAD(P)H-dependent FMN reductase
VDLAEVGLPVVLPRDAGQDHGQVLDRLDRADGFIVVTPEYNHSFPAALKQAIDLANEEWRAKPVAFVSYGGLSGGLRAVEQLRLVFAELHAVGIRDTVSFHNYWELLDEHGRLGDGSDAAATVMLDQLVWWATALRAARHQATAVSSAAAS